MVNWKSKYLEMKLKYMNAKYKGGMLTPFIYLEEAAALTGMSKEEEAEALASMDPDAAAVALAAAEAAAALAGLSKHEQVVALASMEPDARAVALAAMGPLQSSALQVIGQKAAKLASEAAENIALEKDASKKKYKLVRAAAEAARVAKEQVVLAGMSKEKRISADVRIVKRDLINEFLGLIYNWRNRKAALEIPEVRELFEELKCCHTVKVDNSGWSLNKKNLDNFTNWKNLRNTIILMKKLNFEKSQYKKWDGNYNDYEQMMTQIAQAKVEQKKSIESKLAAARRAVEAARKKEQELPSEAIENIVAKEQAALAGMSKEERSAEELIIMKRDLINEFLGLIYNWRNKKAALEIPEVSELVEELKCCHTVKVDNSGWSLNRKNLDKFTNWIKLRNTIILMNERNFEKSPYKKWDGNYNDYEQMMTQKAQDEVDRLERKLAVNGILFID